MRLSDLEAKNIVVWGAGREASSFVRAMQRRRIRADIRVLDETTDPRATVEGLTVEAFDTAILKAADIVVRSPGVSRYRPELIGLQVTTATNLFFAEPHAPVIAYTGTKGKSTSSALTAHLLNGIGMPATLAGNIGRPPLDLIDEAQPHWWVLELSSFQVSDLHAPVEVAVLTSLSAEHLDWHGSVERYRDDKLNLLRQAKDQVLNVADAGVAELRSMFPDASVPDPLQDLPPSKLLGPHNAQLIRLVWTVLRVAGVDVNAQSQSLAASLATFEPLPHRLEPVGERNGVLYINDSLATTPIATMAAIRVFVGRPVTVMIGGHDRGVSYDELGEFLASCRDVRVITLPDSGTRIAEAIRDDTPVIHSSGLEEAVRLAIETTPPGGVVLMSPGAASFGHFTDYAERGETFRRLVEAIAV